MAAEIRPDRLTAMLAARLGPHDSVGRCVMDFLCDQKLSEVSRVFRDANRESMVASARTMRNRDVMSLNLAVAKICTSLPAFPGDRAHKIHESEIEKQKALRSQEDDPFGAWLKNLNAFIAMHNSGGSGTLYSATCVKLPDRLQAVCAQQHLNPSLPQGISACFAALHESQRKEAEVLGATALQLFNETAARYRETALSPVRFLHLEAALLDLRVDIEIDVSLRTLWSQISHDSHIPANAPAIHASSTDIRTWMNDPANAEALGQIQRTLWLGAIQTIPPEIGKLHGALGIHAEGLYRLPDEMRNLHSLRSLDLSDCHFRELPPVIGEFQHLQDLKISGTFHDISLLERLPELRSLHVHAPVRVLPDALWRRCYNENFFSNTLWDFWCTNNIRYIHRTILGIPAGNLTDIPFEAWFKLNVRIPYLPLFLDFDRWVHSTFPQMDPCEYFSHYPLFIQIFAHLFFTFPSAVIALASAGVVYLIQTALNLPIFLANLFLHYAVEPMVFAFRDAFEYPRMVRVRDLQPGEA